jgi:hypothetical protein
MLEVSIKVLMLSQELQFSELQEEFLFARVIKLYGGFSAIGGWFHFGHGANAKAIVHHTNSRCQI